MAFNINEIKSQLTFGGAKASLFQVAITNPINGIADLKTPFMVQAAQIPEATLGIIEIPYFGRKVKVAGDRTFGEWTVTIINDEDFLIRNAMEQWMASINSHEGNVTQLGSASASEYKNQAQITQYSKTGAPLRTYNFNGLFPTSIAAISMDWNTTDDIERFDVTFQYDWWNVSGGVTGDGGTNT
ncbi:phage tail protein [bacterium]|nr:phage tail protein [bacterium]